MILMIILWIIGGFAGTGVYGMMGDQVGYQASGTGTFGLSNDTIRTIYTILATVALPVLKVVLGKYWGPISRILEILKVKTPQAGIPDIDKKQDEANGALATLANLCDEFNCKDGIGKVGELFTHIHELFQKQKNQPEPETDNKPAK